MHSCCSVRDAIYQTFVADDDGQYEMADIIFTYYDHTITDPDSLHLKQLGLSQLVQQVLYEEITKREYEGKDKKILYIKRIFINIIILGILAASLYGIYAVGWCKHSVRGRWLTPAPPSDCILQGQFDLRIAGPLGRARRDELVSSHRI